MKLRKMILIKVFAASHTSPFETYNWMILHLLKGRLIFWNRVLARPGHTSNGYTHYSITLQTRVKLWLKIFVYTGTYSTDCNLKNNRLADSDHRNNMKTNTVTCLTVSGV